MRSEARKSGKQTNKEQKCEMPMRNLRGDRERKRIKKKNEFEGKKREKNVDSYDTKGRPPGNFLADAAASAAGAAVDPPGGHRGRPKIKKNIARPGIKE